MAHGDALLRRSMETWIYHRAILWDLLIHVHSYACATVNPRAARIQLQIFLPTVCVKAGLVKLKTAK